MAVWNLSPFRAAEAGQKAHNFQAPAEQGRWLRLGGSLRELGDALHVASDAQVDMVRSTPDPWAQFRAFADALLFPGSVLPDVVPQWRGLLTLLALANAYRATYRLDLRPLALAERSTRLSKILRQLLPGRALPLAEVGDATWETPVLVYLVQEGKEKPIGILNPASLVAPGRDIDRMAVGSIPWMKNGLADPTALPIDEALPPHEMWMLHRWLSELDTGIASLCSGGEDPLLRNLRERIQDFARDCVDGAGQPGVGAHHFETALSEPGGQLAPLYRLLRREVTVADPPAGSSDCKVSLRSDLGAAPPFEGLVLLDGAIATTLKKPASQIMLWGKTTLRQALDLPPQGLAQLRARIREEGYLLVEPADFFAPVLAKLDDPGYEGDISAHRGQGVDDFSDSLLPLSPLALLVATPGLLKSWTSRDMDDNVTFRVRLARDDGSTHVIRRRYRENPLRGEGRLLTKVAWDLGDVALWPNFHWDKWRHYFARIKFPLFEPKRLRGRIALSGPALAAMLAPEADRAAALAPWLSPNPFPARADPLPVFRTRVAISAPLNRFRASEQGKGASEIQTATHPIEALFFSIIPDHRDDAGAPLADELRRAVPAGLVVVGYAPLADPTNSARIAIDFGTTNTTACIGPASAVGPATLSPRVLDPIRPRSASMQQDADAIANRDYIEFLPPIPRELPTPSVVISRRMDDEARAELAAPAAGGAPEPAEALLFKHVVYFQPTLDGAQNAQALLDEWTSALSRTTFNLKWTDKPRERIAAQHFLRQLILMLGAEAAARGFDPWQSTWLFSRPESLMADAEANGQFTKGLDRSLATAFPGIASNRISPDHSESIAAAAYILNPELGQDFARGDVNIILDIGGGTTDIAIWNNDAQPKLLWSGSLRVAGGDFFTHHITQNPELLGTLGLPVWQEILAQEDGSFGGQGRPFVAELLFSGSRLEQAFATSWVNVSGTDDVRRLIHTGSVFLAGVAWHVGVQIGQLVRDGRLPASAPEEIAFALCGRGSGLFARQHRNGSPQVARLLRLAAAAAGVRQPSAPAIFLSPHPKTEVVGGMMGANYEQYERAAGRDRDAYPESAVASSSVPAGVAFADGRQEGFGRPGMDPAFAEFLNALETHAGLKVTISEAQWRKMTQVADTGVSSEQTSAAQGLPRFARLLKTLVAALALKPGNPDRPGLEVV